MAPVLGLLVVVRVKVEVVEDDGVGRGQVDAEPARPGGQDEDEDLGVFVEVVDQELSLLNRCLAVQSQVPDKFYLFNQLLNQKVCFNDEGGIPENILVANGETVKHTCVPVA